MRGREAARTAGVLAEEAPGTCRWCGAERHRGGCSCCTDCGADVPPEQLDAEGPICEDCLARVRVAAEAVYVEARNAYLERVRRAVRS